jgi:hypothetical protein
MTATFGFPSNSSSSSHSVLYDLWICESVNRNPKKLDRFKLYPPRMGLRTNMLYALISPIHAIWPSHLYICDWTTIKYKLRMQIKKIPIMQFSPFSCHFISLSSKYSPEHFVVKCHKSLLFIQNEEPSFSSYKTLCKFICMFLQKIPMSSK